MRCEQIKPKITSHLLGDLSEADAALVRDHLESCEACRALARETEPTLDLLRDALAASSEAPAHLSAEHRARIARTSTGAGPIRLAIGWATHGHPRLAVAAGLLLVAGFFWAAINAMTPARERARRPAAKEIHGLTTSGGDEVSLVEMESLEDDGLEAAEGRERSSGPASESAAGAEGAQADRDGEKLGAEKEAGLRETRPHRSRRGPFPKALTGLRRAGGGEVRDSTVAADTPVIDDEMWGRERLKRKDTEELKPAGDQTLPDATRPVAGPVFARETKGFTARNNRLGEAGSRIVMAEAPRGEPAAPQPQKAAVAKMKLTATETEEGNRLAKNEELPTEPHFRASAVNLFQAVAEEPLSTFSIDVDTASYTVARNYMSQGLHPPAEAVRTEEFVNFFDYAYKAPVNDIFKVYAEIAPSKFGRGLHVMKIGVKGKRLGREERRRAATLNTIAADVKIQVEFNPKLVKRYRQLGYENRQLRKRDFRNDALDAGEVGSGQSVTVLYEVELEPEVGDQRSEVSLSPGLRRDGRGGGSDHIAIVRVRYRRTDTGKVEEIEEPVRVPERGHRFEDADVRFQLAAGVAEFAEVLRGSQYAAGSTFEDVADVLRPVALELDLDARVQELLRLVTAAPGMLREE